MSKTKKKNQSKKRKISLNVLKEKLGERIKSLNYIKRLHHGEVFWFNVIKITPEDILNYYHPKTIQSRVELWFFLGISIAPLLLLENGYPFIRACVQLMEEIDYHFSTVAQQGMKILKSMTSSSNVTVALTTLKKNPKTGSVAYEFLRTPNIPTGLSYREVVFSLCDILTFVYRKVMDGLKDKDIDNILKLDHLCKEYLFGRVSKDINNLAMYKLKKQGDILSSLYNTQIDKDGKMKQKMGDSKK